MRKSYRDLIRNTGLLTISSFSSKILVFLLVPLYTSILSKAEMGFYDLTSTTMHLVFPLITGEITSAIMRFCMDKENNPGEVISTGSRVWLLSSLVVSCILLINIPFGFVQAISGFEVFITLSYLTYTFHQLMIQATKGIEKVKELAIGGVIGTIAVVGSNILFLVVFKRGLEGYYTATILGNLIPSIYLIIISRFFQQISNRPSRDLRKRMLSYSIPLVINTVGWWVNNNTDKYVITWLCDIGTNGLLSVAYKIPNILTVIGGIFLQAWQISAIKEYKTDDSFFNNVYRMYNCILVMATATLIIVTKPVASILFQKDFYQAWFFVPFLLVSCFFTQIASYYGPILSAQMNSKAMAISSTCGIVANIVLNISLTLLFGPIGIAIATAMSSFIIYLVRRFFVLKIVKITETKKLYLSWIVLCSLASFITFSQTFWFGIGLYLVLIMMYYKDTIHFFRNLKHHRSIA